MSGPLSGIFWTIRSGVVATFRPPAAPRGEPFTVEVVDRDVGALTLSGSLSLPQPVPGRREPPLLIVGLHGLGGSAESAYLKRLAHAAVADGCAFLRLNFRGADASDRDTPDFYHAGLTSDLDAVLASPALAGFATRALVGFSIGGHLALRFIAERGAVDRLAAVVAVCAPLDLDAGATALDRRTAWLYRQYILPKLHRTVASVERFRSDQAAKAPSTGELSSREPKRRRARGIREFDGRVVAPRFGFRSAEDYYAQVSVAPILDRIRTPTWIVEAENDPMVPAATVRPALARASRDVEVTWTARGGHVGMPADLDLGRPAAKGLEPQILDWLHEKTAPRNSARSRAQERG
ncbi:MAG: alpha/beta fold hydrolase [Thermoanaerobaculia bacterium]